jgi:hypothetical protein
MKCPQISESKTADAHWTYEPGARPALDRAIDEHAEAHGTIWSPHLLGPGVLSFAKFLVLPELKALCPAGSDAHFALVELGKLDCFDGPAPDSYLALREFIRHSKLFERRQSFRYVQRTFNLIWHQYDGLLRAKAENLKALSGAEKAELRADERRTKDRLRKRAARRGGDKKKVAIPIKAKIARLLGSAAKKRERAEHLFSMATLRQAQARRLTKEAATKEAEAERLKKLQCERPTMSTTLTADKIASAKIRDLYEPNAHCAEPLSMPSITAM